MTNADEDLLQAGTYRSLRAPAAAAAHARHTFRNREVAAAPTVARLALGAVCASVLLLLLLRAPEPPVPQEPTLLRAPQLTELRLPTRPPMPVLKASRPEGALRVPRLSQINLTRLKTTENRS